MSEVSAKVI